ncbi:uncharacterized protein BDR25DRAFT_359509 [Lindgomyces ingoldianus]|uniref:Uncharacterized protein n=1 Tax=Lindgomyces ingoldianus TaxID=673940 RepID=A0ACB6QI02_9PLEO|nr:uncharacterized protein BDR25DRAFT_359509 [Lindgomyces ingoldianus]KAF2466618.1 hypothetical protein BDR25DRAFT_359509 [Lindgomyces ingoldianus]
MLRDVLDLAKNLRQFLTPRLCVGEPGGGKSGGVSTYKNKMAPRYELPNQATSTLTSGNRYLYEGRGNEDRQLHKNHRDWPLIEHGVSPVPIKFNEPRQNVLQTEGVGQTVLAFGAEDLLFWQRQNLAERDKTKGHHRCGASPSEMLDLSSKLLTVAVRISFATGRSGMMEGVKQYQTFIHPYLSNQYAPHGRSAWEFAYLRATLEGAAATVSRRVDSIHQHSHASRQLWVMGTSAASDTDLTLALLSHDAAWIRGSATTPGYQVCDDSGASISKIYPRFDLQPSAHLGLSFAHSELKDFWNAPNVLLSFISINCRTRFASDEKLSRIWLFPFQLKSNDGLKSFPPTNTPLFSCFRRLLPYFSRAANAVDYQRPLPEHPTVEFILHFHHTNVPGKPTKSRRLWALNILIIEGAPLRSLQRWNFLTFLRSSNEITFPNTALLLATKIRNGAQSSALSPMCLALREIFKPESTARALQDALIGGLLSLRSLRWCSLCHPFPITLKCMDAAGEIVVGKFDPPNDAPCIREGLHLTKAMRKRENSAESIQGLIFPIGGTRPKSFTGVNSILEWCWWTEIYRDNNCICIPSAFLASSYVDDLYRRIFSWTGYPRIQDATSITKNLGIPQSERSNWEWRILSTKSKIFVYRKPRTKPILGSHDLTYQESKLSKRRLLFTDTQVVLVCKSLTYEILPWLPDTTPEPSTNHERDPDDTPHAFRGILNHFHSVLDLLGNRSVCPTVSYGAFWRLYSTVTEEDDVGVRFGYSN